MEEALRKKMEKRAARAKKKAQEGGDNANQPGAAECAEPLNVAGGADACPSEQPSEPASAIAVEAHATVELSTPERPPAEEAAPTADDGATEPAADADHRAMQLHSHTPLDEVVPSQPVSDVGEAAGADGPAGSVAAAPQDQPVGVGAAGAAADVPKAVKLKKMTTAAVTRTDARPDKKPGMAADLQAKLAARRARAEGGAGPEPQAAERARPGKPHQDASTPVDADLQAHLAQRQEVA